MKKQDKLTIAVAVAIILNAVIALGIINYTGDRNNDNGCFRAENGVRLCR